MTFNSPRPQNGPLLWGAFCLFGLVVAVYVMLKYPVGAESWWVGILLGGTVVLGFVAIEGWWVHSQRQVILGPDRIEVRRWSEALLARNGEQVAIDRVRSIGLIYENGKKVRIEVHGGQAMSFWAALWPRPELDRLIKEAQMRGISVQADW